MFGRGRPWRRLVMPLLAGSLAAPILCGCSDGTSSAGATLPPITSSTVTPTTPTTSPPSRAQEIAAATAVVRRYFTVLNHVARPGSDARLAALETTACFCRRQVRSIKQVTKRGQHYVAPVRILGLRAVFFSPRQVTVLVTFDAGRSGIVARNGRFLRSTPAQNDVHQHFGLVANEDGWLISSIQLVK